MQSPFSSASFFFLHWQVSSPGFPFVREHAIVLLLFVQSQLFKGLLKSHVRLSCCFSWYKVCPFCCHFLYSRSQNSTTSIENFLSRIEEITRFPVRPYVVPFLRLHLPVLQAELANSAAALKLTPSKFLRQNESLILDPVSGRTTSSSSYHSSLHYLLPPGSHSLFTFPPAFVGEAFEIFQPTVANPIFTAPSSLQTIPTSYPYQPVSPPTPILTSNNMGIKENGVASKRRMSSPDSRKENGYIDVEKDVVEITHPAKRQVSSVSRVIPTQHSRGNNASIVSTTHPHVHHHLPSPSQTLLSATSLPLHPINSNGSALQTQLNIRSALMETSLREAVNSSYRFMNGNSSPKEVNGRPENAVENLQHQTSFSDRDRTNTSRSPNYSHLRTLQQRTSSDESVAPELFDDQFKSIYTVSPIKCKVIESSEWMSAEGLFICYNELSCDIWHLFLLASLRSNICSDRCSTVSSAWLTRQSKPFPWYNRDLLKTEQRHHHRRPTAVLLLELEVQHLFILPIDFPRLLNFRNIRRTIIIINSLLRLCIITHLMSFPNNILLKITHYPWLLVRRSNNSRNNNHYEHRNSLRWCQFLCITWRTRRLPWKAKEMTVWWPKESEWRRWCLWFEDRLLKICLHFDDTKKLLRWEWNWWVKLWTITNNYCHLF